MANLWKIDKHYVSEIDSFLKENRKNFPLTESQKAEIKKYQLIHASRDNIRKDSLEVEDNCD